ncbi:MAG: nitroreductase family deazaflavin-dependent oxidoreductase [Acidimicrobiaceae bacterium]|nr:nitroreductase family deazaflavin-dependent oxidoreductase [Acidimicrobiaceae bacterium]
MAEDFIYEPSPNPKVREQVELYERSRGTKGNTQSDTGVPVIIITSLGAKSNKIRKTPVIRVAKDGTYALVASRGGAPNNPHWYHNLVTHPDAVAIQDGADRIDVTVRQAKGDERTLWWELAIATFPRYAEYQTKTDREIPVLLAVPRS